MHITTTPDNEYAREILNAVREIQDTPGLESELATRPEAVLDRLALSGVVRHTVAFAFTVGIVAPAAMSHVVRTDGFWQ